MSHRQEHAVSVLSRAISEVLSRDISDPRIVGMVTITKLEISPDFRQATVHVSILPEQYESRTVKGLAAAAGHIHTRVRKKVAMRTVPRLTFRLDKGLKKQAEVIDAIRKANENHSDEV